MMGQSGEPVEAGDEQRRNAEVEIGVRLQRRGVRLTGRETGEELVNALDAVEQFEAAVVGSGGDLMVDEPVGIGSPLAPDDLAFVLPVRSDDESIAAFVERIAHATARAKER